MTRKKIEVTELVLRDAHQSLLATRMELADMVPACADIEAAGYWSVECWGGATFDACIRFLDEDPWERLRTFRKLMPTSKTQMLLRGQNLLGYRHYDDNTVRRFAQAAVKNGMNVFRVFDALNDPRNLEVPMQAVKAAGGHAQGTICYTTSPLHTVEAFVELGRTLEKMGADSICVKDMAALLKPQAAFEIFSALRKALPKMHLHLHVHATTGVTLVSAMKAIEAGCDAVDAAIGSMSLGPGHNPTQSLVAMLDGSPYYAQLDAERLRRIDAHFGAVRPKYKEHESAILVDTGIFDSQIPGGMITNMESQLRQQGAIDRLADVLAEVPRVRADAGFPPLVTPTSQIVGTQAVFNVMLGRYANMTAEFADLVLGFYGSTIGEKDPEVMAKAKAKLKKEPITGRPADLLGNDWDGLVGEATKLPGFDGSDEDVLTYAMFPKVAPSFFKRRAGLEPKLAASKPAAAPKVVAPAVVATPSAAGDEVSYAITVNGRTHTVKVARLGGAV